MAESYIQVPSDSSGKKSHTFQRTIGANTIDTTVAITGEPYLATYLITGTSSSIATANDHTLQIMAGSTLNVYLKRLRITQSALATTAAHMRWELRRLTTAGTGGSALTPQPADSADSAAGSTAMLIPTAKGTEGVLLDSWTSQMIQTVPTGGAGRNTVCYDETWDVMDRTKCIRIAAGTTNGIAVKNITAVAAATVVVHAIIVEANF